MFRNKKAPVLTATFCEPLENLRLAIEVLTGKHVQFVQVDFNTGRGRVRVGEEEKDTSFSLLHRSDLIQFTLGEFGKDWHTARFDRLGEARVIKDRNPHTRKEHAMWIVGRSFADRWEEPLFKREVEYCAQVRGLTVEVYLGM